MPLKISIKLHFILALALIILGGALLTITQPSALAAGKGHPPDIDDLLAPNAQLKLIANQQITKPMYSTATLLLEDQGGVITDLLPAYINGSFGSFYILKEGDIYYLWLNSVYRNGATINSITQRFESQDGPVWRNRTNTNLAMYSTSWRWLGGPRHVIKDGPLYEAWEFYFYEWVSGGWAVAIRYVTSTNGLTWTVVNQPALQTGTNPSVLKEGSTYHMWAGPDVDVAYDPDKRVRYRTSSSGGTGWGHWKNDGAIISLDGGPLEWYPWPAPTRVRRVADGTYQLFYIGASGVNLATSTEGITFTTQITNLINFSEVLSTSFSMGDFLMVDVQGEDWFYFTYGDTAGFHIAVARPIHQAEPPTIPICVPKTIQFDSCVPNTIQDVNGCGTGFTNRLPNTGGSIPSNDPNLNLSINPGRLTITSTHSDIHQGINLNISENLGIKLEGIGTKDFRTSALFRNVHVSEQSDQLMVYIAADNQHVFRAGLHYEPSRTPSREYILVQNQNGFDFGAQYGSTFTDGDDVRVTITRSNVSTYTVAYENLTNPTNSFLDTVTFHGLDSASDLYIGVLYHNNAGKILNNPKVSQIDEFLYSCTDNKQYLPVIISNWPPSSFPLHIADAFPRRPVVNQGEIFFTQAVQLPDQLPAGGHFYFSTQPNTLTNVLVDDELAILLNGVEIFAYNFSQSGSPQAAILEVPRATMEQIAGQTVTIRYRDIYSVAVEATNMWLIWVP
jgi:hypothetical protein